MIVRNLTSKKGMGGENPDGSMHKPLTRIRANENFGEEM
jgi:hypothetical protein